MNRPKHRLRKPPRLATDSSDWERFTKSILATFAAFALFGGLGVLTHTPAPEPRVSLQASAEPPRIEPIPLVPPITDSLMFRPRRVPVIPVVESAPLASYDEPEDRHERKVEHHDTDRHDSHRADRDRHEHRADRDGHRANRDHHRDRADKGHGRHRADNHRGGRHRADSGHRGGRDHSGSHHGGGGHGSHGGGHHSGGHSSGSHGGHHGGGHGGRH